MTLPESIAAAKRSGPEAQPDGTQVFEFQFDAADPVFTGHFPGRPLLPGIFQVELTRAAAQWAAGRSFAIREIARAKFQRAILPGELVRLSLKLTPTADGLTARATFTTGGWPAGETLLILT